jgi:hypothetical protein
MTQQLDKKIDQLRELCAQGDYHAALRLAASWPRLGVYKEEIQRGWAAASNPRTYAEMGLDPLALARTGVEALRASYCPKGVSWPAFDRTRMPQLSKVYNG